MDKWLRNKTIVQIVALLLGILLWVVVHLEQQPETSGNISNISNSQTMIFSDVKVAVIGLDEEQFHIRSIEPEYVNVTVKGTSADLRKITTGVLNQQILVDLSEFQSGIHQQVPLTSSGFPEDVEVKIDPIAVTVAIERISHKEVPVEVIIQGEPKEGFRAGEAIVQPNRVNVAVPESQVDQIVKVRAVVDITDASEAVITEKKLVAINQAGEEVDVSISPSVAEINVPITSPFKTIPLQIKFSGQVPSGLAIADYYQSVEEVTIYGSESAIAPYDFYGGITINVSDLNRTQTFTYTYNIPRQQQLHQIFPEKVEVILEVVESEKKEFENFPITFIGLNEDVETSILFPEEGIFNLVLEGAPDLLKNVKAENVQAIIDVSNLPPGEYTRQVQLNLPRFIKYGGDPALLQAQVVIATKSNDPTPEGEEGTNESEDTIPEEAGGNEEETSGVPAESENTNDDSTTVPSEVEDNEENSVNDPSEVEESEDDSVSAPVKDEESEGEQASVPLEDTRSEEKPRNELVESGTNTGRDG